MRGIFEFRQYPELFPCQYSVYVVGDIVVNLVICHCADNDIVVVRGIVAASYNEIKPFFCHFFEMKSFQGGVLLIIVDADYGGGIAFGPSFGLFLYFGAIEAAAKVLGEFSLYDSGSFYCLVTSVIYCHKFGCYRGFSAVRILVNLFTKVAFSFDNTLIWSKETTIPARCIVPGWSFLFSLTGLTERVLSQRVFTLVAVAAATAFTGAAALLATAAGASGACGYFVLLISLDAVVGEAFFHYADVLE